jgi:mono/diheme cytochrome c family protein
MKTTMFGVLLLGLVACATVNVPEPMLLDAGGDGAALSELQAGRQLYVAKCSGCHGLFAVEHCTDGEWARQVDEMVESKRVRLGREDRDRLVRYLQVMNGRE